MTLKISPLFRDHAVFQRGIAIPVWGDTEPESRVRCTLGNATGMTVSNDCGRFLLRLPPQSAGGPCELVIENLRNGDKAVFNDIWIGEVYLVSGQSNMEFPLKDTVAFEKLKAEGRLANPSIRYLKVPVRTRPVSGNSFTGEWRPADPEITGGFSAIGYLFAEKIARKTDCKVGIIDASCGGTGAECWMSREALLLHSHWRDEVIEYDWSSCRPSHYDSLPAGRLLPEKGELLNRIFQEQTGRIPPNKGLGYGYARPDFDDSLWRVAEMPDSWNLMGYNHGGVFWLRLAVTLPRGAGGKDLTLSLGALDKGDITYFNGTEVGRTGDGVNMEYWNRQRVYKIPGSLVKNGRNVLAVRIASLFPCATAGGMIGPAGVMFLEGGGVKIPLAVEWKCIMEHNTGSTVVKAPAMCGPGEANSQHMLFDNMIAPLIPFGIRGVLWYQGEANAICHAAEYKNLLQGLIHDWRYRWGQPNMDFLVIQLPGYQARRLVSPHSQWALLREAQMQSGEPLVVTCDTGDEDDIHPRDKTVIAERAAAIAVALIDKRRPMYSPRMSSSVKSGDRLLVKFNVYGSKLEFRGNPDGFAIGEEGNLFRAQAEVVDRDTVALFHPEVKNPQIIYYGWSNFPMGTLFNTHGLPATPFRFKLKN
jgi:sialate O-acetylesterase